MGTIESAGSSHRTSGAQSEISKLVVFPRNMNSPDTPPNKGQYFGENDLPPYIIVIPDVVAHIATLRGELIRASDYIPPYQARGDTLRSPLLRRFRESRTVVEPREHLIDLQQRIADSLRLRGVEVVGDPMREIVIGEDFTPVVATGPGHLRPSRMVIGGISLVRSTITGYQVIDTQEFDANRFEQHAP